MPPAVNCRRKGEVRHRRSPFAGEHGSEGHGYGACKTRSHADGIQRGSTRRQNQKCDADNTQKTSDNGQRPDRRGEKQPRKADDDQG